MRLISQIKTTTNKKDTTHRSTAGNRKREMENVNKRERVKEANEKRMRQRERRKRGGHNEKIIMKRK